MGNRRSYKSGFRPESLSKVSAWLRHTQTTGDLTSWTSMLDSNHATANAARAPAAGASAGNARPIATFTGANNDAVVWALNAANNQTTKTGFAFWVRQPTSALEMLISISTGTNSATARKYLFLFQTSRRMLVDAYISGTDGRRGTTAVNALPAAGTWVWVRCAYDSAGATEDDRSKIYINAAQQSLTFSNLGAGGTLGELPAVTGNAIIGNFNDGVDSSGLDGDMGPNLFCLGDDLTTAEETNLMNFEAPS